jgi:hypothetical protein
MRKPKLPTSPAFWRSPLRGPWFTSVLGVVLLGGITVLFVTGLLSYAAYNPDLAPVNDQTPGKGLLGFYLFSWPTDPSWLYRLTQGVHVTLGITLIPYCWRSCGRSCRSCSRCRRCGRSRTGWSGSRCSCWSAARCSSSSRAC